MTPCVSYTRVSSEEQAKVGYSIPFQRARLEQFATERGLEILARFEDVQSAKQTGRAGFADLVRYLEEHPAVRTVIVHRVDRLIRNHYEYGLIVEQLGARVCSVVEPAEDNAAGRLMHGVNVAVSKYHSDNLSQEVKKGMRGKFEAGGCVTRAPIGYRNIPRTKTEKGKVSSDPERAPVIRRLFERYAQRHVSLRTLAAELFDHGLTTRAGKPYHPDRIRDVLRDPFYKGVVRYHDEQRPGQHEPIVPAALWDKVQQVLAERSFDAGDRGRKFFLLRGLLRCAACGRRMTGEDHARGSYYRCIPSPTGGPPCVEPYVPLSGIDQAVVKLLPSVALTAERLRGVLAALDRVAAERETERGREEHGLMKKRERLGARIHELTECLADGTIARADYRTHRDQYERERRTIDERLHFLKRDLSGDVATLKVLLQRGAALSTLYAAAVTDDDRKALLREVFAEITVKDKHIDGIEYNPPFHLLLGDTPSSGSGMTVERELLDYVADERPAA